jgi:hypothetical protein
MQCLINGFYGMSMALGLYVLGVPQAPLWGFLSGVLRYAPFVGAPIAAMFPITLSIVLSEGWLLPALVVSLIVVLELICTYVLEPLLFGHSLGVSGVAQLTAAAFWAFLWGPTGLVLSNPMTVCLLVLGKNVPGLRFLEVLLGDQPALTPVVSFFQRLMARDQVEALSIVQYRLAESAPEEIYDDLFVPALYQLRKDRMRQMITETEERTILQATQEILAKTRELLAQAEEDRNGQAAGQNDISRVSLVLCAAQDERDEVALEMFQDLLKPGKWDTHLIGSNILAAEVVAKIAELKLPVICLGSLAPGGLPRARYLCKRLRKRFPKIRIMVGRWGQERRWADVQDELMQAGADHVEMSLLSSLHQLQVWFPVLAQRQETADQHSEKLVEPATS